MCLLASGANTKRDVRHTGSRESQLTRPAIGGAIARSHYWCVFAMPLITSAASHA